MFLLFIIMQSLKEIIDSPVTTYRGSEATKSMVEEQLIAKYGKAELKNLDCYHNMRTFHSWLNLGWKIRRGEKAIKSITAKSKRLVQQNEKANDRWLPKPARG